MCFFVFFYCINLYKYLHPVRLFAWVLCWFLFYFQTLRIEIKTLSLSGVAPGGNSSETESERPNPPAGGRKEQLAGAAGGGGGSAPRPGEAAADGSGSGRTKPQLLLSGVQTQRQAGAGNICR